MQLKVHIIEAHLPAFAKRWHTVGLFAEDACESIHALVNVLNRRFACVHGVSKADCKRKALAVLQDPAIMQKAAEITQRRARGPRGPYAKKVKTDKLAF